MTSFKNFELSTELLKAVDELGFERPTGIQEAAIPKLTEGEKDLIGIAQTGTGKTAAFGLPLLEHIDPSDPSTQALILAPTRELGKQIADQLYAFSKFQEGINVLAVYGGAPIDKQIRSLKKPRQIIIATPGRLIDLISRKAVDLGSLKYLVLDEADEMLDMGFKDELDRILGHTPDAKKTWLFSATMPKEIRRIVNRYMDNPEEVRVKGKAEVNGNIEHQYVLVKPSDKPEALMRFLEKHPDMRGLAFCRTRRETQKLADQLFRKGYKADSLHGDLSQKQRDKVMDRFRRNGLQVLIATDVAARGIDVDDLTHVFHYDLPEDIPYYTHRSGRTARAGKKGISVVFMDNREHHRINRIQKQLGISFDHVSIPDEADIDQRKTEKWCMEVLEKKTRKKLDPRILEQADNILGNLSKEELLAKVLKYELDRSSSGGSKDLDLPYSPQKPKGGSKNGKFRNGHFKKKNGSKKFKKKKRTHFKG